VAVSKPRKFKWLPFYMLLPLAGLLLFLDEDLRMDETLRMVLLGGIVVLICALAVNWIEKHPSLVEGDGVDSLHGHFLLEDMTPYWDSSRLNLNPAEAEARLAPVRHGDPEAVDEGIPRCEST
jgi:hypothetical protein